MKKYCAVAGLLVLLWFSPVYGDQEKQAGASGDSPSMADMDMEEREDATIFSFSVPGAVVAEVSIPIRLTEYYDETGGFKEVVITCFLPLEIAFPSNEYNTAADQVFALYDAFIGLGVPEADVFISVRFEREVTEGGVITVEFLKHAGYFQRVGKNFITGITDIVSSPMELPMGMVSESRKSGAVTGVPKGVFSGFGQALRKAGTGTIKLLTFWAG